jgi:hypothetical protein
MRSSLTVIGPASGIQFMPVHLFDQHTGKNLTTCQQDVFATIKRAASLSRSWNNAAVILTSCYKLVTHDL